MSIENKNDLILEEIRRNRQEIKAAIEAVEVRIVMKIEEQKQRINDLEEKYENLAEKVENIERKCKENNIVIFGLQKKPEEINVNFIITEIKNLLDVDLLESDLNNYYPLSNNKNCPLKLEFVSYLKKAAVLRNAKKLKGKNISIVNDMTTREREESKVLRKHLQIAKQNKNNICYIKKNKLHLNNITYTVLELKQQEQLDNHPQPRSAPETPIRSFKQTKCNIVDAGKTTVEANEAEIVDAEKTIVEANKAETPHTLEITTKISKELKETGKTIGKEAKEGTIKTRSKK